MNLTRFAGPVLSFLLALSVLLVAGCANGAQAADPVPPAKRGLPVGTVPPQPPPPKTTPLPISCGDWSAPTGAVGGMIVARYGEIRGCEAYGKQIIINTLGSSQKALPGVIAILQCAEQDASCRDGRTPHQATGWQFFPPPYWGGVTIMQQSSPDTLIIDNAGHQICFSLSAHTYDLNAGCH